MELLQRGDADSQVKVIRMLREQTGARSSSRSAIVGSDVATPLIQFIRSSVEARSDVDASSLQWAAGALWNISALEETRPQIVKAGGVGALMQLVTGGTLTSRSRHSARSTT